MSTAAKIITPAQLRILQALSSYHYLTQPQINLAAGYAPSSASRCQSHIRALVAAGLLDRRLIPGVELGQRPYLYTLSAAGWRMVSDTTPPRFRPGEFKDLTLPTLTHTLTLNDVLISASRFAANSHDISVARSIHDLELANNRAKVTFYATAVDGSRPQDTVSINPDAFIEFSLQLAKANKKLYKSLIVELDRGTQTSKENEKKLRRKMVAYVHYAMPGGEYQKQFGADTITITYITTAGEKRRKQLLNWCADELKNQNLLEYASIFRFVDLPDEYTKNTLPGLDPSLLWSLPVAYKIGEPSPSHLLWKP